MDSLLLCSVKLKILHLTKTKQYTTPKSQALVETQRAFLKQTYQQQAQELKRREEKRLFYSFALQIAWYCLVIVFTALLWSLHYFFQLLLQRLFV